MGGQEPLGGQEPPSGESTTTECWVNYQLLAVITEVAQWVLQVAVAPISYGYSELQSTTTSYGQWRQRQ